MMDFYSVIFFFASRILLSLNRKTRRWRFSSVRTEIEIKNNVKSWNQNSRIQILWNLNSTLPYSQIISALVLGRPIMAAFGCPHPRSRQVLILQFSICFRYMLIQFDECFWINVVNLRNQVFQKSWDEMNWLENVGFNVLH